MIFFLNWVLISFSNPMFRMIYIQVPLQACQDLSTTDSAGKTALLVAAGHWHVLKHDRVKLTATSSWRIVCMLLENGADTSFIDGQYCWWSGIPLAAPPGRRVRSYWARTLPGHCSHVYRQEKKAARAVEEIEAFEMRRKALNDQQSMHPCLEFIKSDHHEALASFLDTQDAKQWIGDGGLHSEGVLDKLQKVAQRHSCTRRAREGGMNVFVCF